MDCGLGEHYGVSLGTRKTAQTGILHEWQLYANDRDEKMCLMRSNIMMALLYGPNFDFTGPVFRRVHPGTGAILAEPVVCADFCVSRRLLTALSRRPPACFRAPSRKTCRLSRTRTGPSSVPTPSAVEDANTASRSRDGRWTWSQDGAAGRRRRLSQCFATYILQTTITSTRTSMTATCPRGPVLSSYCI